MFTTVNLKKLLTARPHYSNIVSVERRKGKRKMLTMILFILGLLTLSVGCILCSDRVRGGGTTFIVGFVLMIAACGIF